MNYLAALLFVLGAITDWLDGYLARHLNQISLFGAFLDPVADKLIIVAALVLLVSSYGNVLMAIPGIVIISREIVISALREWMAELGKRSAVKVGFIGKIKTAFQMIAITLLLLQAPMKSPLNIIALVFIYIAVALTLWSMLVYLHAAWQSLSTEEESVN